MRYRIPAIIFLCLVLFFGTIHNDSASQGPVGISITPLRWDLTANPGDTLMEVVTAINPNDFPLTIVPEFQDFRVLENAGIQWIPTDVENPYRMTDWIHIQTTPIVLKPKGQINVPFSIKVPRNATVGGHYAAIFFRAVLEQTGGGTIGSTPRVGALLIFNVNGRVDKSGEIVNFSAPRFINRGPTNFDLLLKNTGTTHYQPTANITIQNIFGPRTTIQAEQDKFLYPGVGRDIKAVWKKSFPLGIYFANASFIDGNGNAHNKSIWFIGFPWKYFLIAFGILIALRYTLVYLKKRFKIVKVGKNA